MLRDKLLSDDLRQWRDSVEAEGFSVAEDGFMRVWKTKYLAELIPKGVTHEVQARELAQWADIALRALQVHDPGVTLPPKPVRRRRKGSDVEPEGDVGQAEGAA